MEKENILQDNLGPSQLALKLSDEEWQQTLDRERKMIDDFRAVPLSGKKVNYLGENFIIEKDVFAPMIDSKPLIDNFTVNPGDEVLDVCTGSGVIGIFSAKKGAERVVGLDNNPAAVECARKNVNLHGLQDKVEIRQSDMFEALDEGEQFDIITANLPFMDIPSSDVVESSIWDTDLKKNREFFANIDRLLKPDGRIYFAQANFGPLEKVFQMADEAGFTMTLIGVEEVPENPTRKFYAFELLRK